MYAYIDETGNTGKNVFDPAQPEIWLGALLTHHDFDAEYNERFNAILSTTGIEELHAAEIGYGGIEQVAKPLQKLLVEVAAKFNFSRVVKYDLAAFKLFDVVCDPGENMALSQYHYNIRMLRFLLLGKLYMVLDGTILNKFWNLLMELRRNDEAIAKFFGEVLERVQLIPDNRARELLVDAFTWAMINPDRIDSFGSTKTTRKGHTPNMVAFAGMLRGICARVTELGASIDLIKHDRQVEFKSVLESWHKIYERTADVEIAMPFQEPVKLGAVGGSRFVVAPDTSPGLQVVDVALWLTKRFREGDKLPSGCRKLFNFIQATTEIYDVSLRMAEQAFMEDASRLEPVTELGDWRGRRFVRQQDEYRQDRMLNS